MERSVIRSHPFRSLAAACLTIYLGTAPVYWLPGLPAAAVGFAKLFIVLIAVFAVLIAGVSSRRLAIPLGIPGALGLVGLVAASVPGIIQGSPTSSVQHIVDLVTSFVFLWTLYNFSRLGGNSLTVMENAALLIAAFSAIVTTSSFTGVPAWSSPFGSSFSLANAGFGGTRTGWSNGVALYVPVLLALALRSAMSHKAAKSIIGMSALVLVFSSQLAVGGRAGLIASSLGLLVFSAALRRMTPIPLLVSGVMALLLALGPQMPGLSAFVQSELRLEPLSAAPDDLAAWDTVSAGRIETYLAALPALLENPLFGHGIGGEMKLSNGRSSSFIHNQWLRHWVEIGLLFPAALGYLVAAAFSRSLRTWRLARKQSLKTPTASLSLALGLIILVGLTISMLEPSTLLGTFQNAALWWGAIGIIFANRSAPVDSTDRLESR